MFVGLQITISVFIVSSGQTLFQVQKLCTSTKVNSVLLLK